MTDDLQTALEKLFSLPNWPNRIGSWNDVNEAVKNLNKAWQKEKALVRLIRNPKVLDDLKKSLESGEITEGWK